MKAIASLIYLLSLITIYATYLNNESSELQYILYNDLGSGDYKESSTSRFDIVNFEFPNISQSAIPIKGIVARYYFYGGDFEKAFDLLHSSKKANPYIMFNQSLIGEIHNYLGVQDSALYYNKIAFTGLPQNNKHFLELSKSYVKNRDYHKIDSIFDLVKGKKQPPIWLFYMSTLLTNEENITDKGKENALAALEFFSEDTHAELMLASKFVIYGTDNINKSLGYESEASDYFNDGLWLKAALAYENASKLNPSQYTHFENAGISFYKFGYYDKAKENLKLVIDSLNPATGKSEYILSEIYKELGDYDNACDYIRKSSKFNYRQSYAKIGEYCK